MAFRLPPPRNLNPHTVEFEKIVESETREADALIAQTDAMLGKIPGGAPVVDPADHLEDDMLQGEQNISSESEKLSRLVDDDFPFDESQLLAAAGIVQQQYGCLIGAAGTGKTTLEKKIVDLLRDGLDEVDMSRYWERGEPDEKDDYEIPEKLIPSIVMVSFTGRASQMTKKNFPRDWHGNIMTIHRGLGFYPEFFMSYDEESGGMKNKRRFVPAYTAAQKMPWKIVIVDEAGMLGLDLWTQLLDACEPDTRIYLIGDIQQLPPTHGKSILGFALASWPTWELTHVHRQQGANNSIVDNAHRVLKGLRPVSDLPELSLRTPAKMIEACNAMVSDPNWRFATIEIDEDHRKASLRIRQMLKLMQGHIYEPNRDVVITPINGFEQTAPGYSLGQMPMNQELVVSLNADSPRYFIDAGRERQNFALGDKVMATVNDYEAGITNGMTGIITKIENNGGYLGDTQRFGLISVVNDYYAGISQEIGEDEDFEFSLDDMVSDATAGMDEAKQKEQRDAGPASHIVTVLFGEGDHSFEISFDSKSRVASLMLAYVATCHKMQGGECPVVFVIVHQSNKRPLNREWLYTGITRASQRCIVLFTKQGMGFALGKQSIKGVTLAQKVQTFIALTQTGLVGAAMKVRLPKARSLTGELIVLNQLQKEVARNEQTAQQESRPHEAAPRASGPTIKVGAVHIHIHESPKPAPKPVDDSRDAGTIVGRAAPVATAIQPARPALNFARPTYSAAETIAVINGTPKPLALPAPVLHPTFSTLGAVRMMMHLERAQETPLLTYTPKPAPPPIKTGLAALINAQKRSAK